MKVLQGLDWNIDRGGGTDAGAGRMLLSNKADFSRASRLEVQLLLHFSNAEADD